MQTVLRVSEDPTTAAAIRIREMQDALLRMQIKVEQYEAVITEAPEEVTWTTVSDMSHVTRLMENTVNNMGMAEFVFD